MKKRKWIYIQKPQEYEIKCDLCGGDNIEWSEFESMIWCYDCQKDTRGDGGVFDGPIPMKASQLLGMNFDRIDLKTGARLYCTQVGNKITWRRKKPKPEHDPQYFESMSVKDAIDKTLNENTEAWKKLAEE